MAAGRAPGPRAPHEYSRLVRTIYIWPGGSAHHQARVEEDIARWHAGLAFQPLDDRLDGKAGNLLGAPATVVRLMWVSRASREPS